MAKNDFNIVNLESISMDGIHKVVGSYFLLGGDLHSRLLDVGIYSTPRELSLGVVDYINGNSILSGVGIFDLSLNRSKSNQVLIDINLVLGDAKKILLGGLRLSTKRIKSSSGTLLGYRYKGMRYIPYNEGGMLLSDVIRVLAK